MKFTDQALALLCMLLLLQPYAHANNVSELNKPIQLTNNFIQTTETHFVQFFSSGNATKAEGMKNTLKLRGYPAFVFTIIQEPANQAFYQVQVGPFASRELAMRAKMQVIQQYPQYRFLNDAILKTSL